MFGIFLRIEGARELLANQRWKAICACNIDNLHAMVKENTFRRTHIHKFAIMKTCNLMPYLPLNVAHNDTYKSLYNDLLANIDTRTYANICTVGCLCVNWCGCVCAFSLAFRTIGDNNIWKMWNAICKFIFKCYSTYWNVH